MTAALTEDLLQKQNPGPAENSSLDHGDGVNCS